MAHRTDFPEQEGARTTILNGDILVHMPWCCFRAPVSTLKHQPEDGVLDLIDVADKFHAVFLTTFWLQRNRNVSKVYNC
jgi:hypothetical protein